MMSRSLVVDAIRIEPIDFDPKGGDRVIRSCDAEPHGTDHPSETRDHPNTRFHHDET